MEQFAYLLRPTRAGMLVEGPTAEEGRVIGEHFAYLQELLARGVLKLAGRTLTTGPESFGIAVFEAADAAAAAAVVAGDPAVAGGVMTAARFPFRVALAAG